MVGPPARVRIKSVSPIAPDAAAVADVRRDGQRDRLAVITARREFRQRVEAPAGTGSNVSDGFGSNARPARPPHELHRDASVEQAKTRKGARHAGKVSRSAGRSVTKRSEREQSMEDGASGHFR